MDPAVSHPLFVYGTLLDDDVRALVLGHATMTGAAVAPRLRTVFFPGRTYPGLVEAAGGEAVGLLLENLSLADMAALDAYEGEEYERRVIAVLREGVTVEAETYWPLVAAPDDSPDWSLPDWHRHHKAAMLLEITATAKSKGLAGS